MAVLTCCLAMALSAPPDVATAAKKKSTKSTKKKSSRKKTSKKKGKSKPVAKADPKAAVAKKAAHHAASDKADSATLEASEGDKAYSKAAMQALSVARFHYKRGEFEQAAVLLHNAYKIQPKAEFLFNAARAEHRAMKLVKAKRHFEQCLTLKDASPKVRRRAQMHIKEIESMKAALAKARREAGEMARPKTPPVVKKVGPPPSPSWQKPAGWAGVGVGAVLIGAGAVVWAGYAGDQQTLNDKTDVTDADGKVTGIDWARYETEQEDLNGRAALRTGLMVSGVAVAAAGGWLLYSLRESGDSAWQIGPGAGRSLVATLRF